MKRVLLISFLALTTGTATLQAQSMQDGLRAIEFEKFESAKTIFTTLIKQNPAAAENYYYLGRVFLAVDNEDSAVIAFTQGTQAVPDNGLNYAGLGEVKILENKLAEAEALFAKAMTFQRGKNIPTTRAIARAYIATGNVHYDKALEYANKAVELDKSDVESYNLLGDVYLEKPDASNAVMSYERGGVLEPKNPRSKVKVANIWLRLKNVQSTLDYLDQAKQMDSLYAPLYKTYSKLYYLAKQYDKARSNYEKFLDLSERSPANMRQLASILASSGQYREALGIVNLLMAEKNKDIYLYRIHAYSIYEVGVAEKIDSVAFYQTGIASIEKFMSEVKPEKVNVNDYTYKGKLQIKAGQDSLGIATMMQALAMDSNNIDVYNEIALIHFNKRNYAEAANYFDKYVSKKASPSLNDYFYLATSYYRSGNYAKSDTGFMNLMQLKPDYAEAYYYRGMSRVRMDEKGTDSVAVQMLTRFVELGELDTKRHKRNLIESYNYLAVVEIKAGNNDKGKEYLNKILVLDPENKVAKDLLGQLEKQ